MTKLPEIRERSVVRFSVIPSAKYSCSGSCERFSNGKTTIDSRDALAAGLPVPRADATSGGASTEAVVKPPRGQAHQPAIAMAITATRLAAMTIERLAMPPLAEEAGAGEG